MILAMQTEQYFGAGTCGKYLARELGAAVLEDGPERDVDEPLIQFTGPDCEQQTKHRGSPNVGYVFTDSETLTAPQVENLMAFDVLVAGSTWNANVISKHGFDCSVAIQGVDTGIFRPMPREQLKDRFVIYSGGKWEHRKGQDLVIRAVREFQKLHGDVILVASWFNIWSGKDGYDEARKAGVHIIGLPLYGHDDLAWHMNQTDVGLFPNRCEGGTNLVMMDYLACGKPVIARNATGQKDILDEVDNIDLCGDDDSVVAQMVDGLKWYYADPRIRSDAGDDAVLQMKKFPWSRTAREIRTAIDSL